MNTHNHAAFQVRSSAQGLEQAGQMVHLPIPGRVLTSDSLLRGNREIGIEHEGSMYRLKLTRQGKLILNK